MLLATLGDLLLDVIVRLHAPLVPGDDQVAPRRGPAPAGQAANVAAWASVLGGFVGEVNRFGNALIRPHDLDLGLVKVDGAEEAMIERVSHLGFEVRVELSMASGDRALAAGDPR